MAMMCPIEPRKWGSKYAVVLVDAYSKYIWIKSLKTKKAAAFEFSCVVNLLRTQRDVDIKYLRTEKTYFVNDEFEKCLKDNSIIHKRPLKVC